MVKNTHYVILFKTRGLYIQTYSSIVTIVSTLAMTTYLSIKYFNQELLSRTGGIRASVASDDHRGREDSGRGM